MILDIDLVNLSPESPELLVLTVEQLLGVMDCRPGLLLRSGMVHLRSCGTTKWEEHKFAIADGISRYRSFAEL